MKKPFFLLIAILSFALLVACGSEETSSNEKNGKGASNEEDYANYPTKPIEFIVQYGAGGATDLVYRPLLKKMEEELGGKIIVNNITEGAGVQGAQAIANSEPDGYTAGVVSVGQMVVAPLFREMPVSLEDYELVGAVGTSLYGIIAPKDAPYDDFDGFIKYLEENSGKLVASYLPNNLHEILFTWIKNKFDVEFSLLPFDSVADTSKAVQDGSADFSISVSSVDNSRIEAGDVKFIAPIGDMRWPIAPDVPTLQEQGYDEVLITSLLGMGFPKGTPEPIVKKWEDALQKVLEDPEIITTLQNLSTEPSFKTSSDFVDYLNLLDSGFKKMLGRD